MFWCCASDCLLLSAVVVCSVAFGMATKGCVNRSAKPLLKPSVAYDNIGCYICVSCGSYTAQFYLDRFDESKRSLGKCILWNGSWYTPSEFETHCGKKSKKWKQSIMHSGKQLSEFSLSCPPKQGAKQVSSLVDNQTHCGQDTLPHDCSQVTTDSLPQDSSQGTTTSVSTLLSHNSMTSQPNRPFLVNTVLSFIKAYRLKGDNESLKKRVCEHFSPGDVEDGKKLLWDFCRHDLEAASLPYHTRRGTDRRSQMAANLDDIVQAFVVLDSSDLIPGIYCEATDLLQVPSLSLDPVSEKVETNTLSLQNLVSKIDHLEAKLSSLIGASNNAHSQSTYAAVTSSTIPVPSATASLSQVPRKVLSKPPFSSESRDCNLILFGLPETKSIVDSKEYVDEMLEFLVGKPVIVKDMFRLGKYDSSGGVRVSNRPRPVLIKLTTPWDRKLILLCKRNLQNFKVPRLFLREDLPPDHRFRIKNLNVPSTMGVQSVSSNPPLHTNTLPDPIQDDSSQSQPIATVSASGFTKVSDSRESISLYASPVSSRSSTPVRSYSLSPSRCNSSASSSSTVVQGGSNDS